MLEEGGEEQDSLEFEPGNSLFNEPMQIEDVVCEGQELLVQVSREPLGTKGTRITSHITLPGRYLVLMPTIDHVGISRRIRDEGERRRLRDLVLSIRPPGTGLIVRTASEGAQEGDLKNDMDLLTRIWGTIQRKNEGAPAPRLIYSDLTMVLRAIRDLVTPHVKRVVVDSKEEYERITQFVGTYMPRLRCDLDLYEGQTPIFDAYGIEMELDKALKRKVWLKSGGYIVIEMTEALTAIDVNTGKFVGKSNLEDTILKTNLEAAKEIAYQLRLRNIGGIIIIDFIDMGKESGRELVYQTLEEALNKDRAKSNILKISELGLVEMTRKRTRENLGQLLGDPCPYCEGLGYVKSKTTVCYDIFREIERVSLDGGGDTIVVDVNSDVAQMLCEEERASLEDLEKKLSKRIVVQGKEEFHRDEFEIVEL